MKEPLENSPNNQLFESRDHEASARAFADPSVIDSRELRTYMPRSNRPALLRCAGLVVVQFATGLIVWFALGSLWLLPAMALHGFVLVHWFALLHECAHMTAFKTRSINNWVAWVCGIAINLGPRYFQYEHTQHHTYTQNLAQDPQHITLPENFPAYLFYLSGLPYWYFQFKSLFSHAFNRVPENEKIFLTPAFEMEVVQEARILCSIYAVILVLAVANGWLWPLYLWIVPLLLGEPAMRFIRMSEHVGMPMSGDLTINTRTNHVAWPYRVLCWNMNYHAEHHFAPSVPFHALPALNRRIGNHLPQTGGYIDAHQQIRKLIGLIESRR